MKMSEIRKLNDYQHSRQKTEMYLGSRTPHTQTVLLFDEEKAYLKEITWVPALFTAFREAFDNALDEVIGHGFGDTISVSYDPENLEFTVSDNGRGIPLEHATMVVSETKAGRNFGDRGEVAGTNGLGISIVNYCSSWFILDVKRDGKHFTQKFEEDRLLDESLIINEPKIVDSKRGTGTTVNFRLSPTVFKHKELPLEMIKSRVIETSNNLPKKTFYFNDVKLKKKAIENCFGENAPVVVDIEEEGFKTKFFIIPNFLDSGFAAHSLVNNIPAFNGGNHVDTFKKWFFPNLLSFFEKESKKRKLTPNRSDAEEKVFVYNVTTMKAPNFDSQSKTRLINEEPNKIVYSALTNQKIYRLVEKKYRSWIDEIYERCANRTNKKDALELEKLAKKVQKKKIPKLIEANSSNRQECVLLLTEGDSAIASMGSARNPKIHAGLPLRGKILNVNGELPKKVLENAVLTDIMNATGLQVGKKAKREELRYGKIYIAHDMDPDGYSIGALLVNFFYTYWPELFEVGSPAFINVMMTPFIILEKGKERVYFFGDNYYEYKPEDYKGYSVTRAKGLGSLIQEDWEYSLKTPRLFPILDDGKMKESLDLIFNGSRSDDRKTWISL